MPRTAVRVLAFGFLPAAFHPRSPGISRAEPEKGSRRAGGREPKPKREQRLASRRDPRRSAANADEVIE